MERVQLQYLLLYRKAGFVLLQKERMVPFCVVKDIDQFDVMHRIGDDGIVPRGLQRHEGAVTYAGHHVVMFGKVYLREEGFAVPAELLLVAGTLTSAASNI